ncbi:hypothetical protein ABIC60_003713 [Phyllobacterium ifriqiyense]
MIIIAPKLDGRYPEREIAQTSWKKANKHVARHERIPVTGLYGCAGS